MKIDALLAGAAVGLALTAAAAFAQDADLKPCDDCTDNMTVVSWGGAYQTSQQKAYTEPYAAADRAQASPGTRARTRRSPSSAPRTRPATSPGISSTSRARTASVSATKAWRWRSTSTSVLAPGADGSTPTSDFGDSLINECFIPQIVFSTTFGYRTDVAEWNGKVPTTSAPSSTSRASLASARSRSGPRRTSSGRCFATASPRMNSTTCSRPPRVSTGPSPSSRRSRIRRSGGRPAPRRRSFSPTRKS